jgi:hypothetical protein
MASIELDAQERGLLIVALEMRDELALKAIDSAQKLKDADTVQDIRTFRRALAALREKLEIYEGATQGALQ